MTAPELVVTRVFDAPRELVFDMWAKPEHVTRWFGPKRFALLVQRMDFRVGGTYRFLMRAPDGSDFPFSGTYREIVAPERLVYTAVLDVEPDHEMLTTVVLEESGGKTRMTVRQTRPRSEELGRGQEQGLNETVDHLVACVAGPAEEYSIRRAFDAPPAVVFKAWTDAGHFARWFRSPQRGHDRLPPRPAPRGRNSFCHRSSDAASTWIKGFYGEIVAPTRLVLTFYFSDADGRPARHPILPEGPLNLLLTTAVGLSG
ncbi:MAG: SRPBCC family protein [Deltaproteobacteria bacterium]|nr:SRPBCC family protein [Deltaproteobacteria bacterium]